MTSKDMPKTVNPVASPEGMRTLSVTEAVRNFADLVNRAFYQGAHFRLTRGGRAVAELWPPSGGATVSASDLRLALGRLPRLGADEAAAFSRDIEKLRQTVGPPRESPWE